MHGGVRDETLIDFSISVNPFVPSFLKELEKKVQRYVKRYNYAEWLEQDFRKFFGDDAVIVAGATEALHIFGWTVFKGATVIIPRPAYSEYERVAKFTASKVLTPWILEEGQLNLDILRGVIYSEVLRGEKIFVLLGNPNNPTGIYKPLALFIQHIAEELDNQVEFIIDEAFIDFVPQLEREELSTSCLSNLTLVRTFTKILGLPGIRVGYVTGSLSKLVEHYRMPWAIGADGFALIEQILENYESFKTFLKESASFFETQRAMFSKFACFNSKTNYFVLSVGDVDKFLTEAHAKRMHFRRMEDFGLPECVRVGLKDEVTNSKLMEFLECYYSNRTLC
ncbi:aminotransferase class I/II-fold pyridoxal phosphate-dependent enzyme [Fervidobacterium thailandense]|uniref:histidinol-phosphate transaminase n=1 Tax=Fervidobacterium thailandense TaxID=1008305 RepID=A0A1E3G2P7_9BACT|nr:aminotransferase class I/II-fold pyridoxal phosphate-dependent enzyme [Fervidobacterium thailandense]ODN30524.1 hypothetical protein A4H02_04535 [Fervidobacterium thailandense]